MSNTEYLVAWSIPGDWPELTAQWPSPASDMAYWRVWADQSEASVLLTEPSVLTHGTIVFFVQIESAAMPSNAAATSVWEQQIWRDELIGNEAAPFAWRGKASLWREPYLYTFSLGCVPPKTGGDSESYLAFCRYLWDFHHYWLGLCAQPAPLIPQPDSWQMVADDWYGYRFELPAGWYDDSGPTADRVTFFSHPVHQQPAPACPIPENSMKVEFSADSLVTVSDGNWTAVSPIANRPTWLFSGDGSADEQVIINTKTLAIQGTKYWYRLSLYCHPQWTTDCDTVFTLFQNSFAASP